MNTTYDLNYASLINCMVAYCSMLYVTVGIPMTMLEHWWNPVCDPPPVTDEWFAPVSPMSMDDGLWVSCTVIVNIHCKSFNFGIWDLFS